MRLASDRNPAAQANCIAKVPPACCSCLCLASDIFNSIREHFNIYSGAAGENLSIERRKESETYPGVLPVFFELSLGQTQ